jgi:hypothetical protein
VQLAIESILGTMVIGAWTAFEVLAEDLWVTCLNSRPRLGLFAINALPDAGDDEKTAEQKGKVKVTIPAWLLLKENLDLNKSMGTLLQEVKWDFSKRGEPLKAFAAAFPQSAKDLAAIFDDQSLRWLAQVRHVLVHNAGKADPDFERNVGGHSVLGGVGVGNPVPLDGPLVTELVEAGVKQSKALIQFVDEWLTRNPK